MKLIASDSPYLHTASFDGERFQSCSQTHAASQDGKEFLFDACETNCFNISGAWIFRTEWKRSVLLRTIKIYSPKFAPPALG